MLNPDWRGPIETRYRTFIKGAIVMQRSVFNIRENLINNVCPTKFGKSLKSNNFFIFRDIQKQQRTRMISFW